MMPSQEYEKIEALQEFVDDYSLLIANAQARLLWLKPAIDLTKRRLKKADRSEERRGLALALDVLQSHRGHVQRLITAYTHNREALRERLTKVGKDQ